MDNEPKELCTIRVVFTVTSDDQALTAKRKIKEATSDIEDAQIQFSLMDMPAQVIPNARIR